MIFGEKERRKGADIYFSVCPSHLPLSLSLNVQMKELGKKSGVWVQPKASGELWVQPKASGGLSIAVWWVQGADLATLRSPRAPTLQEAGFLPEAPVK